MQHVYKAMGKLEIAQHDLDKYLRNNIKLRKNDKRHKELRENVEQANANATVVLQAFLDRQAYDNGGDVSND